jgi:hypothetical protein
MRLLPNFFVAGAPNAGTTSLYSYLAQHPAVYMSPIKEPTFFGAADLLLRPRVRARRERVRRDVQAYLAGGAAPGARYWVLDWEHYVELFRNAREETAIGEASVSYLWLPSAARAIRERIPEARLIFILRDPADRLFTRYLATPRREARGTFREQFHAALDTRDAWALNVNVGHYGTHLQRFFDAFPHERIRVHLYEDYRADARAVVRDLFAFLGVDPHHPVDLSRRHHETMLPRFPRLDTVRRRLLGDASPARWLPEWARRPLRRAYRRPAAEITMTAVDRSMVVDYYRDEILRTSALIGRDLSAWLQ